MEVVSSLTEVECTVPAVCTGVYMIQYSTAGTEEDAWVEDGSHDGTDHHSLFLPCLKIIEDVVFHLVIQINYMELQITSKR